MITIQISTLIERDPKGPMPQSSQLLVITSTLATLFVNAEPKHKKNETTNFTFKFFIVVLGQNIFAK